MDNQLQQKFHSLGFFGIFKEAFKTIFSAKKIFSLITLSMIFPLSLVMFSHLHILQFLIKRIVYYLFTPSGNSEHHSLVVLWTIFSISNAAYLVDVFILYLLSTSSVVYTLVSIYAGNKALTFRELLSVVVKVSKKFMMIGRIWWMIFYQIFTLFFLNYMCFWNLLERPGWFSMATVDLMLSAVSVVIYGSSLDWHLACVFSIFEDSSNTTDLGKDKICTLIKGKLWFVHTIVAVIQLSAVTTLVSFNLLVVRGNSPGFIKVSYWIIFTLLLSVTILLGFVMKTLIYFVCKADLGESNIDDKQCLLVVLRLQEEFVAEKDATRTTSIKEYTYV